MSIPEKSSGPVLHLLAAITWIVLTSIANHALAQTETLPDPASSANRGAWSATGSLTYPRSGHTATRLRDGTVLVAGGYSVVPSSVEIFDPATNRWSLVARLGRARAMHTATLLPDGRVLVAGGTNSFLPPFASTETAEIYDPASGRWSDVASMGARRTWHKATLLLDGTVLVAGDDSAEIYDPAADSWRSAGRSVLGGARYAHSMTQLRDGRVLVAGGVEDDFLDLATDRAQLYDPVAGTWSAVARLPQALSYHAATLLADGNVLVSGGYLRDFPGGFARVLSVGTALLFDPVADIWSETASLSRARSQHTATALSTGEIVLAGGLAWEGTYPGITVGSVPEADLYEAEAATWTNAGSLSVPRTGHTATTLADGRILVAGGQSGSIRLASAEIFTRAPVDQLNYSGVWFDPAESGHGLFLEHLAAGRITASWFTFDPDGRQAWFIGVGTLSGNSVTMDMLLTRNGRFPPAFASSDVVRSNFGQMTLRFDSCDAGLLSFALPAPFGSGTMPLRRPERPAGIACSSPTDLAAAASGPQSKATGPVAALTGTWANPGESGHGFQMEVLSGDRLVLSWYVFDETGEQMWLIGAGPISGQSATVTMVRTAGGRFIPNFDPALVTRPTVGTLTVTASSCDTARVDYAFAAPFGSGSVPIARVTSVRGAKCTP